MELFDYSNSRFNSKMNDIALWSHCEGVIGNASGATHVPSILFGKPTLYIGFSWLKGLAMWHGLHFHNGCIPSENYWLVSSAFHEGVWVEPNERLNAETTTNEDIFNKYSITDLSPETLLQGAQIFLSEQFENIDKKSTNFNLIKRFDLFSMPEGKGTPFKPLYRESGDGRVLISRV